jgi:tight adherence protein C
LSAFALTAAICAGLAVGLLVCFAGPVLERAAAGHRERRPRRMLFDDFHLRGPTALVEPFVLRYLPDLAEDVERRLLVGGRPWNGISGPEYAAFGLVTVAGAALFGLASGTLAGGTRVGVGFAIGMGALAGYVWHLAITSIIQRRERNSWKEFPFFLDTLVMTMEAGATLPQGIEIYVRGNPQASLARDMDDALNRVEAGADILRAIEETLDRVTVEEISSTMRAIIQAERQGADRMRLLRETAQDVRDKRWEAAEEAAEALKAKLTLPTMMVMMAVFILVMGPALLQAGRSGLF